MIFPFTIIPWGPHSAHSSCVPQATPSCPPLSLDHQHTRTSHLVPPLTLEMLPSRGHTPVLSFPQFTMSHSQGTVPSLPSSSSLSSWFRSPLMSLCISPYFTASLLPNTHATWSLPPQKLCPFPVHLWPHTIGSSAKSFDTVGASCVKMSLSPTLGSYLNIGQLK